MFRFETLRPQQDDRLAFLKGFLRQPRDVGSVIPSSRFLERKMVRMAGVAQAQSVIELGPGTGGTTRAILAAMPESATLLAIELDPAFADHIREIDDRRLIVHQGSAEQLAEVIVAHRLRPPDAILSGIPFSTMPHEVGTRIIEAIRDVLAPGGRFVAYQFRAAVAERAKPILGEPEVSAEFLNIPPMRVYRWRKR
ncbi:MAG: methyltransferase domain-containing protein [Lautropia sp.]|jgi:phospholipid N-methyltransferase|nr:methyltransferase domain-containing protein [Lautropia sp.]MCL4702967.1 methyltransferase domain-containing protein [Burkholderiaceae bacterium]MCZ2413969.1 methyltransferase domain-containing protein [Burkholderiales bacterium]MDL1907693.1 methyltransferase domain-containing protein [Betaproteobacteria bacterium PRO1]MEB2336249.1 methyltransferase domain-containing protein [Burkholderiales bacterium]